MCGSNDCATEINEHLITRNGHTGCGSVADLEGVPWVPWNLSFERLPSFFTIHLVSLRKHNYIRGKQIYGELARSTAIGLLHAQLYQG